MTRTDHFRHAALLWIVLDPDFARIASHLANKYKGPIHLSIHDDAEAVAKLQSQPQPMADYLSLLQRASTIDTVSERLANRIRAKSPATVRVLMRGFDPTDDRTSSMPQNIKILMGGWFGTKVDEVPVLLEAFRRFRSNHSAELHLIDARLKRYAGEGVYVHRWLDPESFAALLNDCSIGFAHDSTTPSAALFAQTSLPTKVVTYIGHGKPFLYHGPRDSTVGDLLSQFKCGEIVSSREPADLVTALVRLTDRYQDYAAECRRARGDAFNIHQLRSTLYALLERE